MGDNTGICWADATWDFAVGCEREPISESCRNCWARAVTHRQACNPKFCVGGHNRFGGLVFERNGWLGWTGEVRVFPELLDQPLHWRKPRSIFACSRTDVALLPDRAIDNMLAVMSLTPRHTYLLLTKRIAMLRAALLRLAPNHTSPDGSSWPLPNLWVFATVTTQAEANHDLPFLSTTQAAHLGINIEPALEAVDLSTILPAWWRCPECHGAVDCDEDHRLGTPVYCTGGDVPCTGDDDHAGLCENEEPIPLEGCHIGSVIFGCESGPKRRLAKCPACGGHPFYFTKGPVVDGLGELNAHECSECGCTGYAAIEWARLLRDQCRVAGIPFYYKQGPDYLGRVSTDHILDGQVEWNLPWGARGRP